ncbi:MAG: SDR family NAD(P)-dependent oxidoreductase [Ilumatobacteraceae bacterium]
MSQSVVLITGTSSGIGLESSIAAAQAGFDVIATMRDLGKSGVLSAAAERAGVTVEVRQLDVVDPTSVRACVDGVIADHGRLDAVINNAGTGHVGTIELESVDDVRSVMEINFFGVVNVVKASVEHLRASRGRLITVSSVGGAVGQPFNEAYCAAKFAVEGFMESLAPVLAQQGVQVVIVEPGAVASEFVSNVGVDPAEMLAGAGVYTSSLNAYITRVLGQFTTSAQAPAEAAATIVSALTDEDPPLRVQTSSWATGFVGTKLTDTDGRAVLGLTSAWVAG